MGVLANSDEMAAAFLGGFYPSQIAESLDYQHIAGFARLQADALAVPVTYAISPDRIWTIAAENRIFQILDENRVFQITDEDRVYTPSE